MKNFQKVKIVATLGPASDSFAMIKKLAEAGVTVFRINLSHGKKQESIEKIKRIRSVEHALKKPIGILGDLAGPKIRIGDVIPNFVIHAGQTINIYAKPMLGSANGISVNIPSVIKNLEIGAEIYIADGVLKLEVVKKGKNYVTAIVLVGGLLESRKGFSAQGLALAHFRLSAKDKEDIAAMSAQGIDALAVSFVQSARDIETVKKFISQKNKPLLIAKIETAAAVKNAEKILGIADGIMIARGDLGLSVPLATLPHIQKNLIDLALKKAKPVITATQMLESMIHNPLPTRAEVTDIANAILDGTDAVMLSGETAVGKFPLETVLMMKSVIDTSSDKVISRVFENSAYVPNAVGASAVQIADRISAKLIIAFSYRGSTARRIASHRPGQIVIATSPHESTARAMDFIWGVHPHHLRSRINTIEDLLIAARAIASRNQVFSLKSGDYYVISAGIPFGEKGTTNLVLIQKV